MPERFVIYVQIQFKHDVQYIHVLNTSWSRKHNMFFLINNEPLWNVTLLVPVVK